jgi:YD repeat-containing protein
VDATGSEGKEHSSLPCFEIDSDSSLYPNAVTQTFYDALGRKVETRTPGPVSGDDTVVFTLYNDSTNSTFTSVPFAVADGSGYIDPASAVYVSTSQAPGGTTTFSDALGRTLAVQDPNFGTSQEPGHACSSMLSGNYTACTNYTLDVSHVSGDSNTYETVTSVDPNDHVAISSIDALGRTRYVQIDSGVHSNTSTLMGNERKSYQYNVLNEATSVTDIDLVPQSNETVTSVTTTASYDSLGRMTQLVDPERGTHSYTYDADGHLIADVSGSRTLGYSYDLLGRVGCIQDQSPTLSATGGCTSGANPFVQNTYDTNMLGTQGSTDFPIGRLTQTKATNYFPGPDYTQGYVTEQMQYDNRGRLTYETLQISASGGSLTFPSFPTYQLALSYNDADQPTTTTTSSNPSGLGYSFTTFYDSTTGALTGLGTNTSSANLATLSYNLNALPNTYNFQSSTGTALAQEQFSYDPNLRITNATATWQSGSGTSGTIYNQALGYDAASNIISSTTTQAVVSGANNSGGSETEIYCYDEQNRLVWAGNSGTPQEPATAPVAREPPPTRSVTPPTATSTSTRTWANCGKGLTTAVAPISTSPATVASPIN